MPQTATKTQATASLRQTRPALAWERHQLFQEPVYPEGLALLDEDDEDEA
jgi:hypothetical protein